MTKRLNRWFIFADEDRTIAERALEEGILNQVCFHAQQGVEKLLKGKLHDTEKRIPKTHHLTELLGLCITIDNNLKTFEKDCMTLDRYYIPTRYPDALPGTLPEGLPNERDAREAIEIFDRIRTAIVGCL